MLKQGLLTGTRLYGPGKLGVYHLPRVCRATALKVHAKHGYQMTDVCRTLCLFTPHLSSLAKCGTYSISSDYGGNSMEEPDSRPPQFVLNSNVSSDALVYKNGW